MHNVRIVSDQAFPSVTREHSWSLCVRRFRERSPSHLSQDAFLSQGNTAPVPLATSSATWDDATASYTPAFPISLPGPNGGLQATELGINTNGRIYFDTVAPSDVSFTYNGSNYGGIVGFRDLAAQWAVWQTDLDPTQGGDMYVMEPSPNLGGVMVWWDSIPNYPGPAFGNPATAGETSSCSIEFTADGSVVNIAFGQDLHGTDAGGALIGFSAGNGEPEGGLLDWSSIPALPGAAVSGDGSQAPRLQVTPRPIAGAHPVLRSTCPPPAGSPTRARTRPRAGR